MPDLEAVYDEEQEQALLAVVLEGYSLAMLTAVHTLVAEAFPDLPLTTFRLDEAATRRMLTHAAERVVRIDDTTRQALRALLQRGQTLGLSPWEVAHGSPAHDFPGIDHLFQETWKHRAETIAQTELAQAQLTAALDRYAATGKVSQVQLVEHTDTDAPCVARNGRRVPLASNPGLLHPNCRLRVIPILAEETP